MRAELHRYYDRLTSGICLIGMEPGEPILFVNKGMLKIYHCTDEADFYRFTGKRLQGMVDAEDYYPIAHMAGSDQTGFVTFRFRTRDEHFRRAEGSASVISLDDGKKAWLLQIISSELKGISTQTDSLTGLLGMRSFFRKAFQIARESSSEGRLSEYCPIYFNLTHFRLYNSLHGVAAGDHCLKYIVSVLRKAFPDALISHLSADGFGVLATKKKDLFQTIEVVCSRVNGYINNSNIVLKAGVCLLKDDDIHIVRHSFDMAKIACDTIKTDATRCWAIYTREMGVALEKRDFVLENFNTALEKGYIKIYYQPVVRTMTGKICGVEALARWEDPVYGRLTPNVFIPVLEQARLIHKLDGYVLNQVAKQLHYQLANKRPVLPVSVNLSRHDFNLMDPFAVVEKVISRYNLQRDYFRIEVTETALVKEKHNLLRSLKQFQQSGYQVWLDDFGSAYSSLNVLHNYHFDELKIDMAFLHNFNEQSRQIIKAIVLMAKELGIHTLAEGAETKAHVDFLKDIGCEKIQGYYFGRPMTYEDLSSFCKHYEHGLETRREEPVYDKAGLVNVVTDLPTAIFHYDGIQAGVLWANLAFRKILRWSLSGYNGHDLPLWIQDFSFRQRLQPCLDELLASGQKQVVTYVERDHYLQLHLELIGGNRGRYLGRACIYNIADASDRQETQRIDYLLRNILKVYKGLYYLHPGKDTLEVIKTTMTHWADGKSLKGIQKLLIDYAVQSVYVDDRERFLSFLDFDNLCRQADQSPTASVGDIFRIKQADGSYRWTVFLALLLQQVDDQYDILLCCRDDVWETARYRKSLLPILATSLGIQELEPVRQPYFRILRELCQAMIHYSDIKFFWKDRERRFAGVSHSFLDYYGLTDEKSLIGKTDEEIGWHIQGKKYEEAERAVLEKGEITRHIIGECLVQGRPHRIAATKFPIYQGRRIIGLMGYFEDLEYAEARQAQLRQSSFVDDVTGLLNFRGILQAADEYVDKYRRYGQDYTCVLLEVPAYEALFQEYGDEVGQKLLQVITQQLLAFHTLNETIAHLSGSRFCCLVPKAMDADFRNKMLGLINAIHGITNIGGYSCTLYLQYAVAQGSEGQDFDEVMQLLRKRLSEAKEQQYGQAIYIGDRLVFDKEKFDKLDEEVSIIDPDTYELVYVNDYMQRSYGLSDGSGWVGEKCYKILAGRETPCDDCLNDRLRRDCFYTVTRRNRKSGQYMFIRTTLIPWQGKNYRFSMAFDLSRYIFRDREEIDVVFREVMANDVIAIGMSEADPHTGLQKMLEKIGHSLQAERVLIFEEQPDQTVSATYEWHQEHLQPMAPTVQHIPLDSLRPLYAAFDAKQMAIIEDAQAFVRAHPGFTPHLSGVRRLVSGHLTQSGKSLGFTEVVNPSALAFKSASLLLSTLTLFLANMLRNRDTFRSLERLSTTDQLTGAGNRRGFTEYIGTVPDGISLAFIFGDLNGLKRINDTQGHEAGDHLIQQSVQTMKALNGDIAVFRMGGDEFMVIARDVSEQQAQRLVRELRARYQSSGISMALGTVVCQTPIANIDEVLSRADREMYADKERIYTSRRHS